MGKYLAVMRANWNTMKAYKIDLTMRLFTVMPIKIVIAFSLWTILFQTSGLSTIGGLTYTDFLLYYTIQAVLGLAIGRNVIEQMTQDVLEGELIATMSKPVRYPLYHLARFSAPAVIFLLSGSVVAAITILLAQLPISLNIMQWMFFGISVILAYLVYYLLEFLIGSLTFYIGRVTEVRFIFRYANMILSGALIPLSVLPIYIQDIAPLLPFASVYYVPLMQLLGAFDVVNSLVSILIQLFWLSFLSIIAFIAWRSGFRRYDAPGG